jgi:hypothetical protein
MLTGSKQTECRYLRVVVYQRGFHQAARPVALPSTTAPPPLPPSPLKAHFHWSRCESPHSHKMLSREEGTGVRPAEGLAEAEDTCNSSGCIWRRVLGTAVLGGECM